MLPAALPPCMPWPCTCCPHTTTTTDAIVLSRRERLVLVVCEGDDDICMATACREGAQQAACRQQALLSATATVGLLGAK